MVRLDCVISFVYALLNEILSPLKIEKLSFNIKLLIFLCFIVFFLELALLLLKGLFLYHNFSFDKQSY